jgi:uncharacterized membrane protein
LAVCILLSALLLADAYKLVAQAYRLATELFLLALLIVSILALGASRVQREVEKRKIHIGS